MYQILIVEDNPAQLSMLEETIRNAYPTWNIHCANNYEEALHCIEHSIFDHKYYTLFLLDIQLTQDPTDRGGYTLAEEIRKNTPYFKTPLLFLTAAQLLKLPFDVHAVVGSCDDQPAGQYLSNSPEREVAFS